MLCLYVHFPLRNKANIYIRNGQECRAGNPVRHKHQGSDTKSCGPTPESWVQPSIGSPREGPTDPVDQLPRGHLGEQLLSHSAVGSLYTTFVLQRQKGIRKEHLSALKVHMCVVVEGLEEEEFFSMAPNIRHNKDSWWVLAAPHPRSRHAPVRILRATSTLPFPSIWLPECVQFLALMVPSPPEKPSRDHLGKAAVPQAFVRSPAGWGQGRPI